jgi:putative ABC transport system ATP-binding protein
MLFELNQESDTTLVLVTHDLHLAKRCARQLVMENGHLSEPYADNLKAAHVSAEPVAEVN